MKVNAPPPEAEWVYFRIGGSVTTSVASGQGVLVVLIVWGKKSQDKHLCALRTARLRCRLHPAADMHMEF